MSGLRELRAVDFPDAGNCILSILFVNLSGVKHRRTFGLRQECGRWGGPTRGDLAPSEVIYPPGVGAAYRRVCPILAPLSVSIRQIHTCRSCKVECGVTAPLRETMGRPRVSGTLITRRRSRIRRPGITSGNGWRRFCAGNGRLSETLGGIADFDSQTSRSGYRANSCTALYDPIDEGLSRLGILPPDRRHPNPLRHRARRHPNLRAVVIAAR